jgi:hypothetical protein
MRLLSEIHELPVGERFAVLSADFAPLVFEEPYSEGIWFRMLGS